MQTLRLHALAWSLTMNLPYSCDGVHYAPCVSEHLDATVLQDNIGASQTLPQG